MDNGLTQKQIDDFYYDVERLGLKFPVAAISKATGYSKGNVSGYLNKKDEPSYNFLKKFYEAYPKSSKDVPRETKNAPVSDFKAIQGEGLLETSIQNLTESNRVLASAILADAENRAMLIKQNEELLTMVKRSVNVQREKTVSDLSKVSEFLELIADIGTGKKVWHSKSEGLTKLNKFVPVHNIRTSKRDIQHD